MDIFAVDKLNRIEVNYCLLSIEYNFRCFLKLFCYNFNPIFTISNFFASASWLEREIFDLFGIVFIFHKNLRRILTDYGFLGHPLRKSFPLVGFLEYRFSDLFKTILGEPVRLTQLFRHFSFSSPWVDWKSEYDKNFS